MNYRRLALSLGVLALGLGVAAIVAPESAAFRFDGTLVSVVGLLALVQALRAARSRHRGELDEAETPDPELPVATPSPGADLETALEQFLGKSRLYYRRDRIQEGLQEAAVAVLTQYGGYSEPEARARLEDGLWTDDDYAGAFLSGADAPRPSVRDRVRNAVRRESSLQRDIRHTVDAIADAAGLDRPSAGSESPIPRREASREDEPTVRVSADGNHGADERAPDGLSREPHSTGHWRGASVVALVGVGVGILAEQPAVLLAGAVGVGFAAYARSSALPPGRVSVDRSLSEARPEPGEEVEVTLTVTNESGRFLPDVRVVDGVPAALAVADGSPRLGTALRQDESRTFAYTVTARRGVHSFDPSLVVARDLTGGTEHEQLCRDETAVTCIPPLRASTEPLSLRKQASQYVGQVPTRTGGEGIEFHATREYKPGDSMSRIDWNHRARTGEFTTIEFRKERAAAVVVVVDARVEAYISPEPHAAHAVDRSVDAAGRLFETLSEAGNHVGVAAVGSRSCWLPPHSGVKHRVEARELLATHAALDSVPGPSQMSTWRWERQFRKRLSPGTQLVFLTPLCDSVSARLAKQFEAFGYPVTVVSPDATADRTASHRLTRVARTVRMTPLRSAGIPVVDWSRDETLDEALARYNERGSR